MTENFSARARDLEIVVYDAIAYREWGADIFDQIEHIENQVIALLRKHVPQLSHQEAELATADLSAEMTGLLKDYSIWSPDEISTAVAEAIDELLSEDEENGGAK
jgi:hypothetical protein